MTDDWQDYERKSIIAFKVGAVVGAPVGALLPLNASSLMAISQLRKPFHV